MTNLLDQIKADLKTAMQAKDTLRLSVLRMLISSIRNKEISLRKGDDVILTNEQVLDVLSFEVKKRKDSIESYTSGGRKDLADKEKLEKEILSKYLPEQLTKEELEKIVEEVIKSKSENKTDLFGPVMGEVMFRVKGRVDGNIVSATVKKKLS